MKFRKLIPRNTYKYWINTPSDLLFKTSKNETWAATPKEKKWIVYCFYDYSSTLEIYHYKQVQFEEVQNKFKVFEKL